MEKFVVTCQSIFLGVLLLVISLITLLKVRLGSRSVFAYTIILFSIGYSLNSITYFFIFAYFTNYYIIFRYMLIWHWFMYKMLSIQSWIFAVQYYESAVNVARIKTMSVRQVKYLKVGGIIVYSIVMIALFMWLDIS